MSGKILNSVNAATLWPLINFSVMLHRWPVSKGQKFQHASIATSVRSNGARSSVLMHYHFLHRSSFDFGA